MAPSPRAGATFHVVDGNGHAVLAAAAGDPRMWSAAFPAVYPLDFTSVDAPGAYHVVAGDADVAITIAAGADLYGPLVTSSVAFFRAQRDGADVDATLLARMPSHLLDKTATAFKTPAFDADGALTGTLTSVGTTVDVSGGWFDAGDYLKFVQTASYVEVLMLIALRDHPDPALEAEARRGLDWLARMWDEPTQTLFYQVGIGDGNDAILGDHDVWRLPEADDANGAKPGDDDFFVSHRPVLRANTPGSPVSPNLAGRMSAAFALGARQFPDLAPTLLPAAEDIYDLSNDGQDPLLTAAPFDFYPETTSFDDLELGAAELAIAIAAGNLPAGLPHTDPMFYLLGAADHATAQGVTTEALNLYEVGGLAHVELASALEAAGDPAVGVTRDQLAALVEAKLVADEASPDAFGFAPDEPSDPVPHALGVAIEAQLAGGHAALAHRQLAWVLGANAWNTSFVIGAGTTYPHCPQHQVANLVGSLDGSAPNLAGATVDGPGDPGDVTGQTTPDGARACSVDGFATFDSTLAYRDAVEDFATDEPADDYTATALLAFVLAAR